MDFYVFKIHVGSGLEITNALYGFQGYRGEFCRILTYDFRR